MSGQINGKFNNVTTMTANNNEVVAISNIINIIKGSKEREQSKARKSANATQTAQPSLVRSLPSLPPKLFIIH